MSAFLRPTFLTDFPYLFSFLTFSIDFLTDLPQSLLRLIFHSNSLTIPSEVLYISLLQSIIHLMLKLLQGIHDTAGNEPHAKIDYCKTDKKNKR